MRREEYEDHGHVPDFIVTQAALKRLLGIGEKRMIRVIEMHGTILTIDLGSLRGRRIRYHLSQEEFKGRLGIDRWEGISMVLATVWSDKIQVSLDGTRPEESVRIR